MDRIQPHPLNYLSHRRDGPGVIAGAGLRARAAGQRVIVLDGDGSLLMNLGSLVTIAEAAPTNFFHFVCENGTYEANGGHPIPGRVRSQTLPTDEVGVFSSSFMRGIVLHSYLTMDHAKAREAIQRIREVPGRKKRRDGRRIYADNRDHQQFRRSHHPRWPERRRRFESGPDDRPGQGAPLYSRI